MTILEGGQSPKFSFQDGNLQNLPLNGLIGSSPIGAHLSIPTIAKQDGGQPLLDAFYIDKAAVVSDRLKRILQDADPESNEFFQVTLLSEDGEVLCADYHIFHVTNSAPVVLRTESQMRAVGVVKFGANEGHPYYLCNDDGIVLSKPAMKDQKIVSATVVSPGSLIVPDTVREGVVREGVNNLRMHSAQLSETSWVAETEVPELVAFLNANPSLPRPF